MGLQDISDLKRRVTLFNKKLTTGVFIEKIILENETFIVNMNSEDQLFEKGINSLGISIDDYAPYSDYTIEIKRMKGQPTNRVTLRDEGDFENSFFLEVNKEQFEIKASDAKTQKLIRHYGSEILGLTTENIKDLIKSYIFPGLIEERNKLIYGKR